MRKSSILAGILVIALMVLLASCGKAGEAAEGGGEQEEKTPEETVEVLKTIDEIDTEGMNDEPLQIESIQLLEDGTVRMVPTEDLLKNAETNDELVDGAIYPFADSGKVKDVYLVRFGN